jgi:signal transduction histidine kinase
MGRRKWLNHFAYWLLTLFVANNRGEGSLHDPQYEGYRRTIDLYSPGFFGYTSASYTLTLYPNEELFEVFGTKNPWVATIGAVCIILFTSILFFFYDFFVRQEFYRKQSIIEAKRRFVRYVSHEVRTPLNSICMGSKLLQQDMSRISSGAESAGSTSADQEQQLKEKLKDWTDLASDILDNANSAVNVLSDLLNFDKVESGTLNLELSIIQFWSLIKRTTDEFRVAASAKNVNYYVDFTPLLRSKIMSSETTNEGIEKESHNRREISVEELPDEIQRQKVIGDAVRLSQVLRNFLSNAIKFTPDHGKKIVSSGGRC